MHDTLLHGETLLVVATGNAEDVALELIAKVVAGNLSTHLRRDTAVSNSITDNIAKEMM